LPCHPARDGETPAHIGEALPVATATAGNPEGSPSDPVTTDPKGEAHRLRAMGNTPALIKTRDAYGATALDPWFVTGLSEGEGCFCVSFSLRPKLRMGLEVRPSFALALNERDGRLLAALQTYFGCGSIRQSRSDRTLKFESRSTGELLGSIIPHFESFPSWGTRHEASMASRASAGAHLPDGRTRQPSRAWRPARDHCDRLPDESQQATLFAGRAPTGAR
jgi:LAGLIDADG endonuclease